MKKAFQPTQVKLAHFNPLFWEEEKRHPLEKKIK